MGFRDHVAYSLMYRLGMRVGEVHRITLDDVNMEKNLLLSGVKDVKSAYYHWSTICPNSLQNYWCCVKPGTVQAGMNRYFFLK